MSATNPNISIDAAPVFLVSADLPGAGSTTFAQVIAEELAGECAEPPYIKIVGDEVRNILGVTNEQELAARLADIPSPDVFDEQIYEGLPEDRPVVIEGKMATTVGPNFIKDRPIVAVDLSSNPLSSAARVLRREGKGHEAILTDSGHYLIENMVRIENRSQHDKDMRASIETEPNDDVRSVTFDATMFHPREMSARLLTGETFKTFVPSWELEALRSTTARIAHLAALHRGDTHPNDSHHFTHQYDGITYNTDRLATVLHPEGIAKVREDLRKDLVDCWFGLMLKRVPRFFTEVDPVDGGEKLVLDQESHAWTPEYYKIAEAWPVLSTMLKGKKILDPFGGAGTLINLLVARDIPEEAYCSDLSYTGGKSVNGLDKRYAPHQNIQAAQLLFDELPSWYKPDFSKIKGLFTADAQHIPLADNAVDYIVADPPYGRNCEGGVGLFLGSLNELLRVSSEGVIVMIPDEWVSDVIAFAPNTTRLTTDVSRGASKLPVSYVHIKPAERQDPISRHV